jgi:hypothetical protein
MKRCASLKETQRGKRGMDSNGDYNDWSNGPRLSTGVG